MTASELRSYRERVTRIGERFDRVIERYAAHLPERSRGRLALQLVYLIGKQAASLREDLQMMRAL